jgi:hypothetical protein
VALAPLFGPPLESAFDEQKTEGRKNAILNVHILRYILNLSSHPYGKEKFQSRCAFKNGNLVYTTLLF